MLFNLSIALFLILTQQNSRVVINEVMANPHGTSGSSYPEDRNEFIELYNISPDPVNIRGWHITDFDATDSIIAWNDAGILINYPFITINTTIIPGYGYAVILDPEYIITNGAGGEIEPYDFPNEVIIVTVGNTTIGNELQSNDPVLLYSAEGDSSSFGTPFDMQDSFPDDAGDGISWERISQWAEDSKANWIPSLDSTGSTPGTDNSILSYFDLSVKNISFQPIIVTADKSDTVSVVIENIGFQAANYWNIKVYDDQNHNNSEDTGERLFYHNGYSMTVRAETAFGFVWDSVPAGEHIIISQINYPDDRNLTNNKLSRTIYASADAKNFQVMKNIFSPDNDGNDDSLFIQYNFTEPNGKLMVLVYNLNGQLVRTLCNQKISSKSGIITWDGKNDEHLSAPIGIYILYLEYKTSNMTFTDKKSVILAKKFN